MNRATFIAMWNDCSTLACFIEASGMAASVASARAYQLRKMGYDIKTMPRTMPLQLRTHEDRMKSLRQRLLSNYSVVGTCWIWLGGLFPNGYGQIRPTGENSTGTHRASWRVHYGDIPEGLLVCHSCDTKACINPRHLFLGTQKDNISDMINKGRRCDNSGERNYQTHLTDKDVRRMRSLRSGGMKLLELSSEFGVSDTSVSSICRRKSWRHVI